MEMRKWRATWAGASVEVVWRTLPFAEGLPSLGRYASGEILINGELIVQGAGDEYGLFDLAGVVRDVEGSIHPIRCALHSKPGEVRCELRIAAQRLPLS